MEALAQKRSKLPIFLTVIGCVILIAGLGGIKFLQISSAIEKGKSFVMPAEAVTSIIATEQNWQPTLESSGSIQAVNGVTVSADSPGIVTEILFESGQSATAGQVLVKLDVRQETAQLKAAVARRQLATLNLNRSKGLLSKQVSSQSDYDAVSAEYQQADASVQQFQAAIDRKTILAPFAGQLGIRQVNVGQYLQSGDPVAPLQSLNPIYVNFALPQQNLGAIKAGISVTVSADGLPNESFEGKITAVNSVVDEATRNVQVQATLENADGKLRPGMYVKTLVILPIQEKAIFIPSSSISYAPYGDSVFVIEEMTNEETKKTYKGARQQFVKLGPSRGDQVAIISGLKPGEEITTSGVFKLRNAAEVLVNNEIQPSNSANPNPEDS